MWKNESSSTRNRRIFKNTLMLYIRMFIMTIIGLLSSRLVLQALGEIDYGIYSIVGTVVVLFSFFNSTMTFATQRFLNYELSIGDLKSVNKVFRTNMTIYIIICFIVIILLETIGLWFLNIKLNIPEGRMVTANWVYQFTILTFCVNMIRVPYDATVISNERMNFYAYVSIFDAILKLGVAILLVNSSFDNLLLYSSLLFVASLLTASIYKTYCTRKFKTTNFKFTLDKEYSNKILIFSGWSFFGQIAVVAENQFVNFLINIFYSVIVNAAMGIANQLYGVVNQFVSSFQTAFNPQVVKSYAAHESEYLKSLIQRSSKFSFFLLYIIAIPTIFNMDILLFTWLRDVPNYTSEFCYLLLIRALIISLSAPLVTAIFANGNIKTYQIFISGMLLFSVPIVYLLLKLGYPPTIGLMISICINIIILVARLIYAKKLCGINITSFIKQVLLPIIYVIVLTIPLPFIIRNFFDGFSGLIMSSGIYITWILTCIYMVGLNKEEKRYIISLINKKKYGNT